MPSRFQNRSVLNNMAMKYMEYNAKKSSRNLGMGSLAILQYDTAELYFPSSRQMRELEFDSYVWRQGDSLPTVAHSYYGDPNLWWIIAWFNKKPLPSDYKLGDVIDILLDYNEVYNFMR